MSRDPPDAIPRDVIEQCAQRLAVVARLRDMRAVADAAAVLVSVLQHHVIRRALELNSVVGEQEAARWASPPNGSDPAPDDGDLVWSSLLAGGRRDPLDVVAQTLNAVQHNLRRHAPQSRGPMVLLPPPPLALRTEGTHCAARECPMGEYAGFLRLAQEAFAVLLHHEGPCDEPQGGSAVISGVWMLLKELRSSQRTSSGGSEAEPLFDTQELAEDALVRLVVGCIIAFNQYARSLRLFCFALLRHLRVNGAVQCTWLREAQEFLHNFNELRRSMEECLFAHLPFSLHCAGLQWPALRSGSVVVHGCPLWAILFQWEPHAAGEGGGSPNASVKSSTASFSAEDRYIWLCAAIAAFCPCSASRVREFFASLHGGAGANAVFVRRLVEVLLMCVSLYVSQVARHLEQESASVLCWATDGAAGAKLKATASRQTADDLVFPHARRMVCLTDSLSSIAVLAGELLPPERPRESRDGSAFDCVYVVPKPVVELQRVVSALVLIEFGLTVETCAVCLRRPSGCSTSFPNGDRMSSYWSLAVALALRVFHSSVAGLVSRTVATVFNIGSSLGGAAAEETPLWTFSSGRSWTPPPPKSAFSPSNETFLFHILPPELSTHLIRTALLHMASVAVWTAARQVCSATADPADVEGWPDRLTARVESLPSPPAVSRSVLENEVWPTLLGAAYVLSGLGARDTDDGEPTSPQAVSLDGISRGPHSNGGSGGEKVHLGTFYAMATVRDGAFAQRVVLALGEIVLLVLRVKDRMEQFLTVAYRGDVRHASGGDSICNSSPATDESRAQAGRLASTSTSTTMPHVSGVRTFLSRYVRQWSEILVLGMGELVCLVSASVGRIERIPFGGLPALVPEESLQELLRCHLRGESLRAGLPRAELHLSCLFQLSQVACTALSKFTNCVRESMRLLRSRQAHGMAAVCLSQASGAAVADAATGGHLYPRYTAAEVQPEDCLRELAMQFLRAADLTGSPNRSPTESAVLSYHSPQWASPVNSTRIMSDVSWERRSEWLAAQYERDQQLQRFSRRTAGSDESTWRGHHLGGVFASSGCGADREGSTCVALPSAMRLLFEMPPDTYTVACDVPGRLVECAISFFEELIGQRPQSDSFGMENPRDHLHPSSTPSTRAQYFTEVFGWFLLNRSAVHPDTVLRLLASHHVPRPTRGVSGAGGATTLLSDADVLEAKSFRLRTTMGIL